MDVRTNFEQILACIFLSVRVNLKGTLQCETPCMTQNKNGQNFIQTDLCALTEAHLKKDGDLFLEAKMQL